MLRFLLALVIPFSLASCSMKIKGVCVSGPNKGQPLVASATYFGSPSGSFKCTLPWGEKADGRFHTSIRGQSTRGWDTQVKMEGNTLEASGDDVIINANPNTQVGTATMLGDQGTVVEAIYWVSVWSPTHGQGKAKDSRGNRYKLIW
jgi:hypothetical protein